MKKFYLLYFVFLCGVASAQTTLIPNPNFEQCLIDLGYDDILDGFIVTDSVNTIQSLDVSSKYIGDLTGIEDFILLSDLDCSDNLLTTLNLSNNSYLSVLNCRVNYLSGFLNLSSNLVLARLECDSNLLDSINLSNNTVLTYINCSDNNLEALSVKNSNNHNFTHFDARNNSNLYCIDVDDPIYSDSNWPNIDVQTNFNLDCATAFGCLDP